MHTSSTVVIVIITSKIFITIINIIIITTIICQYAPLMNTEPVISIILRSSQHSLEPKCSETAFNVLIRML